MKNLVWIFIFFISINFTQVFSQKDLTLEDVIYGGKRYFESVPKNKNFFFNGDSDELILNDKDKLFLIGKKNERKELLILKEFNDVIKTLNIGEIQSFQTIKWSGDSRFWIKIKEHIVFFNSNTKTVENHIQLPKEAELLEYNNDSKVFVIVQNRNLKLLNTKGDIVNVEESLNKDIVIGKSVHRNEFGIHKGVFWSPNGQNLAYYIKDESMVTDYPIVNVSKRVAELESIKYPMAGLKSHHVTIGVYNHTTGSKVYLKTGLPKEKYLTNVSWSGDNSKICIAELNREQNHMKFNVYDATSGELIKTLFEEKGTKWVEPENQAAFIFKDQDKFIWQSEKDGFNHLYLYSLEKGLIKQLTNGEWVVTRFLGTNLKQNQLFFEATKDGVMDRHLYSVSINSGNVKKLSNESGFHSFMISKSGLYAIDNYSNSKVPRKIELINLKKQDSQTLFSAINPFENKKIGEVKLGTLKAADGKTDLNYRMVLPVDFDLNKKYPVIVYVYGGPHSQLVKNSWLGGVRLWQMYMAQKGYIAFTMDNRGTNSRGCEFEKVIHRRLGEIECADQYEGIKYLQGLSYVDTDKIGVHGWSYGGFMTINLMEKYPDVFKVGVSGGPVTDWKYYEIMYGERYMDGPSENPEGYSLANVTSRVDQIKGRLLVIHGDIDPVVVWQHSLTFVKEAVSKRVQLDYFVYPQHEHNVYGPDRVHLMQKVTQYFDDFL